MIFLGSLLDSLYGSFVIQMEPHIIAAKFDLMKIVPACHVLETALTNGDLQPGGLVRESSSGTFALGLAQVCVNLGSRLSPVNDPLEHIIQ